MEYTKYPKLQEITERALEACIQDVPIEVLQEAYPHLASARIQGQPTEHVYEKSISYFRKTCQAQFASVYQSLDVEQNLALFEQINQKAIERRARYQDYTASTAAHGPKQEEPKNENDQEVPNATEETQENTGVDESKSNEPVIKKEASESLSKDVPLAPPSLEAGDLPVKTSDLKPSEIIACHLRDQREKWLAQLQTKIDAETTRKNHLLDEINKRSQDLESLQKTLLLRLGQLKDAAIVGSSTITKLGPDAQQ